MHLTKRRKFWQFRAAADDESVGELLLYGTIGPDDGWGWLFDEISPKQFHEDLQALGDISELRIYINSDGGDVFAGQAIHSMLRRHSARKVVYIDGIAASIASVVAMAGDVVRMPRNAMMMIHNPWTVAVGDAAEFRHLADVLDRVRDGIVAAYERRVNLDRAELLQLLDAETWMTAEEAVTWGFADAIEESQAVAAAVRDGLLVVNGQQMDLSRFKRPPSLALLPSGPPEAQKNEEATEGRQTAPLAFYERAVRVREREMVR